MQTNSNFMVILTRINAFSVCEANKTLSKLDGLYIKITLFSVDEAKKNSNYMALLTTINAFPITQTNEH